MSKSKIKLYKCRLLKNQVKVNYTYTVFTCLLCVYYGSTGWPIIGFDILHFSDDQNPFKCASLALKLQAICKVNSNSCYQEQFVS